MAITMRRLSAEEARAIFGAADDAKVAKVTDVAERFWARVQKTEGCWLWTGSRRRDGYGQLSWDGRTYQAHRLAWELHNGAIPESLIVLHECDHPPCVRPDHLRLGTYSENMQDCVKRGRWRGRRGMRKPGGPKLDPRRDPQRPKYCSTCRQQKPFEAFEARTDQACLACRRAGLPKVKRPGDRLLLQGGATGRDAEPRKAVPPHLKRARLMERATERWGDR